MAIKEAAIFIATIRKDGDFTREPKRQPYEILLHRPDGACVWTSRDIYGATNIRVPRSAQIFDQIGLISPGKRTIMRLEYSREATTRHSELNRVVFGVIADKDNEPLFTELFNWPGTDIWQEVSASGGNNTYSERTFAERQELKEMRNSKWYFTRSELLTCLDQEGTADQFLHTVAGWLKHENTFTHAQLRPKLIDVSLEPMKASHVLYQRSG
jgi:hypothetical protein